MESPEVGRRSINVPLPGEQVFCSSRQYIGCSAPNDKLFMVLCYSRKEGSNNNRKNRPARGDEACEEPVNFARRAGPLAGVFG